MSSPPKYTYNSNQNHNHNIPDRNSSNTPPPAYTQHLPSGHHQTTQHEPAKHQQTTQPSHQPPQPPTHLLLTEQQLPVLIQRRQIPGTTPTLHKAERPAVPLSEITVSPERIQAIAKTVRNDRTLWKKDRQAEYDRLILDEKMVIQFQLFFHGRRFR